MYGTRNIDKCKINIMLPRLIDILFPYYYYGWNESVDLYLFLNILIGAKRSAIWISLMWFHNVVLHKSQLTKIIKLYFDFKHIPSQCFAFTCTYHIIFNYTENANYILNKCA